MATSGFSWTGKNGDAQVEDAAPAPPRTYRSVLELQAEDQLRTAGRRVRGRTAEILVQELFEAHGHSVVPTGVEHRFREWLNTGGMGGTETGARVWHEPDLFVRVPGENGVHRVYRVEVKYRYSGRLDPQQVERYSGYPDTFVVLVTPDGLWARRAPRTGHGGTWRPLHEIRELKLQPSLVRHFGQFAALMLDWPWRPDAVATLDERVWVRRKAEAMMQGRRERR